MGNRITTIEKELKAQSLSLRLPMGKFADRLYSSVPMQIKSIIGGNDRKRILAICGTKRQIEKVLIPIRTFRNRFVQSSTLVVIVPFDEAPEIPEKECKLSP